MARSDLKSEMTAVAIAMGLGLAGLAAISVAAQRKPTGVHVCVGADAVLRFQPAATCPSGSKSLLLAEVEADGADTPEDRDAATRERAALEDRIRALTSRVAALESGSGNPRASASRVFAPFEVLDKSGAAILRITDSSLDSEPKAASRVLLARGAADNYSLFFKTASSITTIALGQTREGAGGLYVNDSDGSVRATLTGSEGVIVFNKSKIGVAKLGSLASGNGYLTIGNPAGNSMVEAGVSEGRGLVRAYPTTGTSPVPVPFFIRGGVWKK